MNDDGEQIQEKDAKITRKVRKNEESDQSVEVTQKSYLKEIRDILFLMRAASQEAGARCEALTSKIEEYVGNVRKCIEE